MAGCSSSDSLLFPNGRDREAGAKHKHSTIESVEGVDRVGGRHTVVVVVHSTYALKERSNAVREGPTRFFPFPSPQGRGSFSARRPPVGGGGLFLLFFFLLPSTRKGSLIPSCNCEKKKRRKEKKRKKAWRATWSTAQRIVRFFLSLPLPFRIGLVVAHIRTGPCFYSSTLP